MAKKSKQEIRENLEAFFRFLTGCLIRKPNYRKVYKVYAKLSKEEGRLEDLMVECNAYGDDKKWTLCSDKIDSIRKKISKILNRYNVPYLPNPDEPDDWRWLMSYSYSIVPKLRRGEFMMKGVYGNDIRQFEVNIWRKKTIILDEMSEWIDKMRSREVYGAKEKKRFDKSPNLSKVDRYFNVFDLRAAKKPPMSYENIILKLGQYFKNKDTKKDIDLARHDFQTIFERIYEVPYKQFDKKAFKKNNIKLCNECRKRKNCVEPCTELEYYLSLVEVKQKHRIGNKDVSEWNK